MEIIINAFLQEKISYEEMMEDLYNYKLRGENKILSQCWNTETKEPIPFDFD